MKKSPKVIIRMRRARAAMLAADDQNVRRQLALERANEPEEPRRETEGQRRRGGTES